MKFDKFVRNLLCKDSGTTYKKIIINMGLILEFCKSAWSVFNFVLHYEQEF